MKRTLTMASLVLLVAGAAFAGVGEDRLFVSPNATFSSTTGPTGGTGFYADGLLTGPSTTNNDDSCDIAVMPAATLLIPYFEVDIASPSSQAQNTVFSITNVTPQPQIAHVTIWTDWSYPVIDFNLWLTGYDVVPVSLYDILRNGFIPPTGYDISNIGQWSDDTEPPTAAANPNHNIAAITAGTTGCAELPGDIPGPLLARVQSALTTGVYGSCATAGGQNDLAVGYITIDVTDRCSQRLPTDPSFYTDEILWDNSLIGDYMLVSASNNFAGGNPMVHIRAVPEGGPNANPVLGTPSFGTRANAILTDTNFPYTFYDRYTRLTTLPEIDRRQPLPGIYAARYIDDFPGGPTGFETRLMVWREGAALAVAPGVIDCDDAEEFNSAIPAAAIIRFDEQENPTVAEDCQISPCEVEDTTFVFEETQAVDVGDGSFFPADYTGTDDLGGWMYLDLNGAGVPFDVTDRFNNASQAWVSINMSAEGRYSVYYDAAMLGNGCSPAWGALAGEQDSVRPAPNVTPDPDAAP